MTIPMRHIPYLKMGSDIRRRLSDFLILVGGVILFFVTLFGFKSFLAIRNSGDDYYLLSKTISEAPLPIAEAPLPTAVIAIEPELLTKYSYFPLIGNLDTSEEPPELAIEPPIEAAGTDFPAPAGPVVRLVIPQLKVDRPVIPLGTKKTSGRNVEWNTDTLFANRNRSDLVGQMVTSVNPGDGGNIVLVGHNYNEGWFGWEGVFANLQKMRPGSKIRVFTEDGSEHLYIVQVVKKIPWSQHNAAELEKHQKYLWPTDHEQLTLVTCGGELLWSWSARIYVVATPASLAGN
jgi:hypothetical protein